jgi:DNA-binding response OmpR family regulator
MSHVLIVDDDTDHAESLAEVLEISGHGSELVFTGEAAIERFRRADFDLVLLDVKLPGLNGIETFHALKRLRPTARVMMMTGYSVEELVAQAIEGGALGVLYKPFGPTQVLDALRRVTQLGKILLADDDPDFVESIVPILEGAHYEVDVASTGAEAFDKLMRGRVDCLLLDLHLLVLSGPELYAHLVRAGHQVPTILVTGGRLDGDEDMLLHSRANGLLLKPFDPSVLLAAIGSAVAAPLAA